MRAIIKKKNLKYLIENSKVIKELKVELKILIIINTNLFIRDNLIDLIKEYNNFKFIISYIYKFKIL